MRRHLTYANVMATFTAFGVLAGGSAYAVSKIGTEDIERFAVTAKKLDTGAVKTAKIAEGAVTNSKIADGSVATAELSPDAAGVALAGVFVGSGGGVSAWFNRLGGQPSVGHAGVGEYVIRLPGFDDDAVGSAIQTATLQSGNGGEINATTHTTSGGTSSPVVRTFDSAGNPADRNFYYTVAEGATAASP